MDSALSQKSVIGGALSALFPELCLECGSKVAGHALFCNTCAQQGILKPVGSIASEDGVHRQYAFLYEGLGKTLFAAAKFSDRRRAVNFLIREARTNLTDLCSGSAVVLALPSRKKFLRRLLRAIVPKQKLILEAFQVKRKLLRNDANKLLGEAERYKRIHESLVWKLKNLPTVERYIIADDVSTTGATLNHAAYLLQKHGGIRKEQITLWALMQRPRLFTPPS
jgi:predicted amidophosphoribosyltransferase